MIAGGGAGDIEEGIAAGRGYDARFAVVRESVLYFGNKSEMRRDADRGNDWIASGVVDDLQVADEIAVARHVEFSCDVEAAEVVLLNAEFAAVFFGGGKALAGEAMRVGSDDNVEEEAAAIRAEISSEHRAGRAVLNGAVFANVVSEVIGVIERGRRRNQAAIEFEVHRCDGCMAGDRAGTGAEALL